MKLKPNPKIQVTGKQLPKPKRIKVKINKPNFGKPKKKRIRTKKLVPKKTESSDSSSNDEQESPVTRQQRKQVEMYNNTATGRDQKARIKARQNDHYERIHLPGLTDIGERGTRRKKDTPFKKTPNKPGTGITTENHQGRTAMSTVSRLFDRLAVTKFLQPMCNGNLYGAKRIESCRK